MPFVTSFGNIVEVLPTGAQSGVHVGHLALHQLGNRSVSPNKDLFELLGDETFVKNEKSVVKPESVQSFVQKLLSHVGRG